MCKMSLSEVSLKWSGFESNMLNNLKYAFRDEDYSDVSLVCEGISVKSHKVVLSACSPLFKNIFAQNPHQFTVIILQDMSLFNLKALLTFIYNGEVNVNQEHLSDLLKAAENLKIRGLTTVNEDNHQYSNDKQTQKDSYDFSSMDRNFVRQENEENKQNYSEMPDAPVLIPKEEPPDLICVEAILNEGYNSENNLSCENGDQPFYMQQNQRNDDGCIRKSKPTSGKSGKIKKKKVKTKKSLSGAVLSLGGEGGKENIAGGEGGVHTDIVFDAFNASTICDDETMSDQTKSCVEEVGPKFPCPFCSRTYHTWGYRRRHVKSRHRVNRLSCKLCEELSCSQSSWFDHVVHQHSLDRSEARKSLVILVEAHSVLTCTSPPSPAHLLSDFHKERDVEETLMV